MKSGGYLFSGREAMKIATNYNVGRPQLQLSLNGLHTILLGRLLEVIIVE
jgi:hypothetical protein